jgi:ribosomal protein L30/L7E
MTTTRRNAEARRLLLGLRRVVHFTMVDSSPVTRPPVAEIKAGTMPKVAK